MFSLKQIPCFVQFYCRLMFTLYNVLRFITQLPNGVSVDGDICHNTVPSSGKYKLETHLQRCNSFKNPKAETSHCISFWNK